MDAIERVEYKGYDIVLYVDDDAPNPRTAFDNAGKMVCFHRRYALGDKHEYSIDEARELAEKAAVCLPLFLLDHSGLALRAGGGFEDVDPGGWDSGQVGWIWCDKETAVREWGKKRFTKAVKEKAENYLRGEVEEYGAFLAGDVYGYVVERTHNALPECDDSCWGFFGRAGYEDMVEEAKGAIDWALEKGEV